MNRMEICIFFPRRVNRSWMNQMSSVTAVQFKEQMAAQMGVDVKTLADVPVSDIGK